LKTAGKWVKLEVKKNKNGKPNIAPLNHLPLLTSAPGGVQQELTVPICRCKGNHFLTLSQNKLQCPFKVFI